MGIDSNMFSPAEDQQAPKPQTSAFAGATLDEGGAPSGKMNFLNFSSRLGVSRIDATIEPYLEKVMKTVKEYLPGTSLERLDRMANSFAVRYNVPDGSIAFFLIQFVSPSDPAAQNFVPQSVKLKPAHDEINEKYAGKNANVVDGRVILAGYQPEMDRFYEMADTIVRTFQVTTDPEARNATIEVLKSTEFSADWRLAEARNAERSLSPHGVAPRMEIGLTLKAKIRQDMGREFRDFEADYRLLGVIGGYTEIREREMFIENGQRVWRYRPVFNITVLNSVIPLEGVGAILLAALASSIYSSLFWARQWIDLGKGQPNPGMVEPDPENRDRPLILENQEELQNFVRNYFAEPVIALQFQDGRDSIPGFHRLAADNGEVKNKFINRLTNFFEAAPEDATNTELSRIIDFRYDGVYGEPNGVLKDSRDIDFLSIAAANGVGSIDDNMRRILLGSAEQPTERARIIQNVTNSFLPLWLDTQVLINADLVRWIIQKTDRRGLTIIDPNSQAESRTLGSFLDGFGSTANLGSIISSGAVNRGLNLSSVWSY